MKAKITPDNHEPDGGNCSCGLKDYEHAWWAGWDTEDSDAAKAAIRRRQ